MIRRVAPALLAFAVVGACSGEIRFEDPSDTLEGGVPPPPPPGPIEAGGADDARADAPFDAQSKRCAKDGDCVLATLHCDIVAGACVPCTNDTHCTLAEHTRCDTALHRCVGCGTDGDCGGGKCQPDTHRCVTPCTTITQCITAEAPLCDTAKGFCVRCTAGGGGGTCSFTPDTPFCDPGGFCVGCLADTDCSGATPRCDPTLGKCVQCTSGSDCPGAAQCDPSNGTCTG